VTDVTPLLPLLLPGQRCTFTLQSKPEAADWRVSLTLRFSGVRDKGGCPAQLLTLPFSGGPFNASYNPSFSPFTFKTPRGISRAVLTSTLTGGWGCRRVNLLLANDTVIP